MTTRSSPWRASTVSCSSPDSDTGPVYCGEDRALHHHATRHGDRSPLPWIRPHQVKEFDGAMPHRQREGAFVLDRFSEVTRDFVETTERRAFSEHLGTRRLRGSRQRRFVRETVWRVRARALIASLFVPHARPWCCPNRPAVPLGIEPCSHQVGGIARRRTCGSRWRSLGAGRAIVLTIVRPASRLSGA